MTNKKLSRGLDRRYLSKVVSPLMWLIVTSETRPKWTKLKYMWFKAEDQEVDGAKNQQYEVILLWVFQKTVSKQ